MTHAGGSVHSSISWLAPLFRVIAELIKVFGTRSKEQDHATVLKLSQTKASSDGQSVTFRLKVLVTSQHSLQVISAGAFWRIPPGDKVWQFARAIAPPLTTHVNQPTSFDARINIDEVKALHEEVIDAQMAADIISGYWNIEFAGVGVVKMPIRLDNHGQ